MIGLVIAQQRDAGADQVKAAKGTVTVTQTEPMSQVSVFMPEAETYAKKCSFNSDCPYGTCTKNVCGGCSFNSDCKGWGKCSNGWCGSCSFNSDCQGFGSCKNGRCEKSPY
jgi:hypothetical protein